MQSTDTAEDRVSITRSEYRRLALEARRNEPLAYLAGALAIGGALLLLNASDLSFWVFVFAGVGVLATGWGFATGRRQERLIPRSRVTPFGGAAPGMNYTDGHRAPGYQGGVSMGGDAGSGGGAPGQ